MKGVLLKDLDLSPEELKEVVELLARKRGIEDYESMSEDRLLDAIVSSNSAKKFEMSKFVEVRIREIEKEFKKSRHKLLKLIRDEIRKNRYEIKNTKNLFKHEIKETQRSLDELENFLLKTKKYNDYDDDEYKGISDIKGFFDLSNDKDYYQPIKVKSASKNGYIKYESNGDKDKILMLKEYLNMIRPYLEDMINDHKKRQMEN